MVNRQKNQLGLSQEMLLTDQIKTASYSLSLTGKRSDHRQAMLSDRLKFLQIKHALQQRKKESSGNSQCSSRG